MSRIGITLIDRISNFILQKPSRGFAQLTKVLLQSDQQFRNACGTDGHSFLCT